MRTLPAIFLAGVLLAGGASAERVGGFVSPGWLQQHLEDERVAVLHVDFGLEASDAKGRGEYLDGHVPNARLVPWSSVACPRSGLPNEMPPVEELLSWVRRHGITPDHRIVVYDTGSGLESARAFVALDYLGFGEQVSILDGQWKRWRDEGRPVSRQPAEVESSYAAARPRPEVLIGKAAMRDFAWLAEEGESRLTILDARSEDEYWGSVSGKGIERPGHIPGARNLPWTRLLAGGPVPALKDDAELRALFEDAGALPGRALAVYCRSGVQASLLYAVARSLGYEPVYLYDASFIEWSADSTLPVVNRWMAR
jgi:thiosulfate/3-mercaptopyruvate sulfurtransferase